MADNPADPLIQRRLRRPAADAPAARQPRQQEKTETDRWPWVTAPVRKLLQALFFGLIFGFLLQKGGVAKFDILVGVLLLENFVVVQVMLSAIVAGMVGVYVLKRLGVLEPHIKETVLGSNIIGGLIFGVGFALLAYCPGTDAAAVGQGNLDALVGIAALVAGSYLFALCSKLVSKTVNQWGRLGKLTLPELLGVRAGLVVPIAAVLLAGVLVLLEMITR